MSIPAFINSFLSHCLSSFYVRNSLQLRTKSNYQIVFLGNKTLLFVGILSKWTPLSHWPLFCVFVVDIWLVNWSFIRFTHAQRNIWTLDNWISPFVAVDKLILLLWDYYQVSRWQTCCLINLNLYIVIYKFALSSNIRSHAAMQAS
jgi:hypothetical protein